MVFQTERLCLDNAIEVKNTSLYNFTCIFQVLLTEKYSITKSGRLGAIKGNLVY